MRNRIEALLEWALQRPYSVVLGVAALVCLPTLFAPLMVDDFLHQTMLESWRANGPDAAKQADPYGWLNLFAFGSGEGSQSGEALREAGLYPWWAVDDLRLQFWRPLSSATALVDYLVSPERGVLAHLQSVLWYLLTVGGAAASFWELRRHASPPSARLLLVALLIFAADQSHLIPVLWLANRNSLLATAFGLFALYFYLRSIRRSSLQDSGASWVCVVLALLSAEFALSTLAYVFSYALVADTRKVWARFRSVSGHLVLVATWALHYAARGFGAYGSGFYVHPLRESTEFAAVVPGRMIALLGDLLGVLPAEAALNPEAVALVWGQGALAVVVVVVCGVILHRRLPPGERAMLRFLSLGALLGLVPSLATAAAGRLLLPASLASAYFFALGLRYFWRRASHEKVKFALLLGGVLRHAIVVPLAFFGTSVLVANGAERVSRMAIDLPAVLQAEPDEALRVFVLNGTDPSTSLTLPAAVSYMHRQAGVNWSWQVVSSVPHAITWTRVDDKSLLIKHSDGGALLSGLMGQLFRPVDAGPEINFKVGDTVRLDGYTIEIDSLVSDGTQPSAIRIVFEASIDSQLNRFIHWNGEQLVPRVPPKIGQSETLEWKQGPMGM